MCVRTTSIKTEVVGLKHLYFLACDKAGGVYHYTLENELGNTVSIFDYEKGHLTLRETVDALPDFSGKNTAAAIRRKGDLLFVSHRGADTIAAFKILSDGGLKLMESTPCGGSSPRDILPVGEFLLSANETTDNVTVLKVEGEKLIVSDIAFEMKNPLCICSLEI